MNTIEFGKTSKGELVHKYCIENENGMFAVLTEFGATLLELHVEDKNSTKEAPNFRGVALGYGDVLSYEKETTYFGATVAPYANRIANAKIEIDGVTYDLDANDNENALHSGVNGLAKKVWSVKSHSQNQITFAYNCKEKEQGFPGNIHFEVTYEITAQNELAISYYAISDKKTTINMTNHTYFNLNGNFGCGNVENHELWIKASGYTPIKDAKCIPTGEVAPVAGTPFDFREAKPIGQDLKEDFDQLNFGQGYDHNFAIDKETDAIEKIASAYSPQTGICMEVWTDCIGVQLYTGNYMAGQIAPNGKAYGKHDGFCLETQYFPNSINEPNFVRPITEANVPYKSKTIYAFSVR